MITLRPSGNQLSVPKPVRLEWTVVGLPLPSHGRRISDHVVGVSVDSRTKLNSFPFGSHAGERSESRDGSRDIGPPGSPYTNRLNGCVLWPADKPWNGI